MVKLLSTLVRVFSLGGRTARWIWWLSPKNELTLIRLRTLLTVITFLCLLSLLLVLLKRNLLSLSPRANPGPSQLLTMAATAVAVARPRGVRRQLVVLPSVVNILYLLVLGMSQGPLGVLVAPKALKSNVCLTNHNGGANYFFKR